MLHNQYLAPSIVPKPEHAPSEEISRSRADTILLPTRSAAVARETSVGNIVMFLSIDFRESRRGFGLGGKSNVLVRRFGGDKEH